MDYYSFFTFLKYVVKRIFNNKFWRYSLICIIILFTLLYIFPNGVSAVSFIANNNNEYTIPLDFPFDSSIYPYIFIFVNSRSSNNVNFNYFDVYYSSEPLIFTGGSWSNIQVKKNVSGLCEFNFNNNNVWDTNVLLTTDRTLSTRGTVFFSNHDIKDSGGVVKITGSDFLAPTLKPPEVSTSTQDLENLNFEVVSIDAWDYSNDDLYFLVYDRNYEDTESLTNLYPVTEILLNSDSNYYMQDITANPETNKIYWIPKGDLGLEWKIGGTYGFRFAIRESIESDFADWTYNYITEEFQFTVENTVSNDVIASFNNSTQETKKDNQFNDINNNLTQQKEQDQQFYDNILSNNYNENLAGDTLTGSTTSTESIDNSAYIGLFSTVFGKFSNILDGDFSTVEEINYPVPNTNAYITLRSDILSSKIEGTFIYLFLQTAWLFVFGMYIFKFSNNLIIKIKSGAILNGYENNNEVITSSML